MQAAGMKLSKVAFEVIGEKEIDGQPNLFYVGKAIATDTREQIADKVRCAFTHRPNRRKRHAEVLRPIRESMEQEFRAWLKPLWPQILQEAIEQTSQEAVDRVAAGECVEDVLADTTRRVTEIAKSIVDRDWPLS